MSWVDGEDSRERGMRVGEDPLASERQGPVRGQLQGTWVTSASKGPAPSACLLARDMGDTELGAPSSIELRPVRRELALGKRSGANKC